jgi:7-cyano-7-deazaguanine tRNA-ribosyltransferase
VTLGEIARIRQAIADGTLWELVDERCRNHPQMLSGYRRLLTHNAELERFDRVSKRRFFYRGDETCARTEVLRYQNQLARLRLGKEVLVACDNGVREGYDTVLSFKPPFGPYPDALKETFPIGQSEIPEWDAAMVRQACRGIRLLCESHRESRIRVAGLHREWKGIFAEETQGCAELLE